MPGLLAAARADPAAAGADGPLLGDDLGRRVALPHAGKRSRQAAVQLGTLVAKSPPHAGLHSSHNRGDHPVYGVGRSCRSHCRSLARSGRRRPQCSFPAQLHAVVPRQIARRPARRGQRDPHPDPELGPQRRHPTRPRRGRHPQPPRGPWCRDAASANSVRTGIKVLVSALLPSNRCTASGNPPGVGEQPDGRPAGRPDVPCSCRPCAARPRVGSRSRACVRS